MSDLCEPVSSVAEPGLAAMLALWRRVLRTHDVRPDDNFFDLGGDSLLAIQLFAEIERLGGASLPVTAIYDAPTVGRLVTLLGDMARPLARPLVLLNDGCKLPAVFILHGVGGHVMELIRLGKSIDSDRCVYAIQARGLDGTQPPFACVDDMAEHALQAVRAVQARGPYILVGYSFGGLVAVEMARQITGSGERMALLALIDTYPDVTRLALPDRLDVRLRGLVNRMRSRVKTYLCSTEAPLAGVGASPQGAALPPTVRAVHGSALLALSRYRLKPYCGEAIFFRPQRRSFFVPGNPCSVWRGMFSRLDVVTVPGDHLSMIRTEAATLGGHLAAHIGAALARGPASQPPGP